MQKSTNVTVTTPRMLGFDGTRFTLRATHGKHYVLFGTSEGTLLTARIRTSSRKTTMSPPCSERPNRISTTAIPTATKAGDDEVAEGHHADADVDGNENIANGLPMTHFEAFGLTVANGHQVCIALAPHCDDLAPSEACTCSPQTFVDGLGIDRNAEFAGFRLTIDHAHASTTVTTRDMVYTFRRTPAHPMRHAATEMETQHGIAHARHGGHIDVLLKVVGKPSRYRKYIGVLGVSLNRLVGHRICASIDVAKGGASSRLEQRRRGKEEVERAVLRKCEVESLFPVLSANRSDGMRGVTRLHVRDYGRYLRPGVKAAAVC